MAEVFFFIAGIGAVCGAIGVVMVRNPFYAVLALVFHLLSLAALFLLLQAQFVAAAQVVVYAGAVMVLYVFVVAYVGGQDQPVGPGGSGSLRVISALFAIALKRAWSSSAVSPPRRRASTTAPTAAISSRNDATSKASRNFVSSSSPIWSGEPKPSTYGAPSVSIAFRPVPRIAMHSSTSSATANSAEVARSVGPGGWETGASSLPTYAVTKT